MRCELSSSLRLVLIVLNARMTSVIQIGPETYSFFLLKIKTLLSNTHFTLNLPRFRHEHNHPTESREVCLAPIDSCERDSLSEIKGSLVGTDSWNARPLLLRVDFLFHQHLSGRIATQSLAQSDLSCKMGRLHIHWCQIVMWFPIFNSSEIFMTRNALRCRERQTSFSRNIFISLTLRILEIFSPTPFFILCPAPISLWVNRYFPAHNSFINESDDNTQYITQQKVQAAPRWRCTTSHTMAVKSDGMWLGETKYQLIGVVCPTSSS